MGQAAGQTGGREAFVDTDAIGENLRRLRGMSGADHVLVQVPADAFGHGALPVARAAVAAGADTLVVGGVDEALALRAAGIDAPVVSWQHAPGESFAAAAAKDVTPALNRLDALERALEHGVRHVQLVPEIGGSQLGAATAEWSALCRVAAEAQRDGRCEVTGIMGSVDAYEPAMAAALDTAIAVADAAGLRSAPLHVADYEPGHGLERYGGGPSGGGPSGGGPSGGGPSGGGPSGGGLSGGTALRLGAALYGLSAYENGVAGLRQALTLTAPVIGVKPAPAGVGVSYGYTHVTQHDTTLLLVPLGYGDGIPRRSGNRTAASVDGVSLPIIGRIAMDAFVLDAAPLVAAGKVPKIGDLVTVIGEQNGAWTAQHWAAALHTTSLDIVSRLTKRITRVTA